MWLKIVAPLVALAIAFGAGFQVASWKASGQIEEAEAAEKAAELESATSIGERDACLGDIVRVESSLEAMAIARDALNLQYDRAIAEPPERVTVYRDRWREVPAVITSSDCEEGLGQLIEYIGTLPVRGAQ